MRPKIRPGDLVQIDASSKFWNTDPAIVISVVLKKQSEHPHDIRVPWWICRLLTKDGMVEKYQFTLKKIN